MAQLLDKYTAFALREAKHDACLGGLHRLLRFWLSLPPADLAAAGTSPATLAASVMALATTSGSLAAYVHAMHVLKDVTKPGDMTTLRGYKALALLNSEYVGAFLFVCFVVCLFCFVVSRMGTGLAHRFSSITTRSLPGQPTALCSWVAPTVRAFFPPNFSLFFVFLNLLFLIDESQPTRITSSQHSHALQLHQSGPGWSCNGLRVRLSGFLFPLHSTPPCRRRVLLPGDAQRLRHTLPLFAGLRL
jgi:hypothetical protein